MSILLKSVVRLVVYAAAFVTALVIVAASGTTDPLGPGLALFLVYVLLALVWGLFDGRAGAARALVVWLVVSVGTGLILTFGAVKVDDTSASGDDVVGTVVFCLVLIGVPALIGIGIGALLGRKDNATV